MPRHVRPRYAARPVFAANEASITEPIERRENLRIIDLAFVRLMARRNRGDLRMANQRQMRFEAPDEIAADDLHVIEIELDAHVSAGRPWL